MSKVVQSNIIVAAHGDTLEISPFHAHYGSIDVLTIGTSTSSTGLYVVPCLMTSAMWTDAIQVLLQFTRFGKIILGQIPHLSIPITNSTSSTTITVTPISPLPTTLNASNHLSTDDFARIGYTYLSASIGDPTKCGAEVFIMATSSATPTFTIVPVDTTAVAGNRVTIDPIPLCYSGY